MPYKESEPEAKLNGCDQIMSTLASWGVYKFWTRNGIGKCPNLITKTTHNLSLTPNSKRDEIRLHHKKKNKKNKKKKKPFFLVFLVRKSIKVKHTQPVLVHLFFYALASRLSTLKVNMIRRTPFLKICCCVNFVPCFSDWSL